MTNNTNHITLELLLQSLGNDFDSRERERIFVELKNSNPTDDALLGAKLLLEENNWDYTVLKKAFEKTENRIDALANAKPKLDTKINYLKYAAVLVPIAFVLGYFITGNFNNNADSIDKYYIKEEGLPNLMSAKKTNWEDLMQLYKSNQLEKAFALFEQITSQKVENDTANYFHAVIAYDLKKYAIAKEYFGKVTAKKESVFYNEATFRMGFTLSKLHQNKEAKLQFETVKEDNKNPYQEEAANILKVLDLDISK
jgi:tetratricopeptide (TPR) repeat protein